MKLNNDVLTDLMWIEVVLINIYNNYLQERYHRKKLYEWDSTKNINITTLSSVFKESSQEEVMGILESLNYGQYIEELDLSFFTNKIDLLENIKN
ncbi:hypothetical protein [Aureivirga sp. CE67]|uniref:hypothetical protein n=1 Tax=Aureivirga sp. CE67 TaxID=1788983 RepID=UPI001E5299A8|nr:hypothetical protein [Aureivirga sp. CE67]